ncbi:heparan-alpha-glucosaminide N-acetyltransferase [Bosea beijingensis]|uniref:heparan-alpha-glucosaminide N-acetyltransferase n=1 Tax=Bosea beijingensis TaxID=3068632 RepID=UPI0027412A59|nr:heparan-alpha-glucosaminide N-acetyltransferase [Bosea sp. REN20]
MTQSAPRESSRLAIVDIARGVALLAMIVYHFAYDLSMFRLIETDIATEPGWRLFARGIAGSFLTIVGFSLVLATRKGLDHTTYLKRLAMVAGAAALVTLGTWFAMPGDFIFFGILHHIAVASLLALPFLRLPTVVAAVAAAIAFALPSFLAHPLLDQPWAAWLGFSRAAIKTADFVPVFPWFGCVLSGIVLARLILPRLTGSALAGWRPGNKATRAIAWGGRHSLLVYLVHQPLLIGALMLATQVIAPPPPEERAFRTECQRSCAGPNVPEQVCRMVCACTVDGLKREKLWQKTLDNLLSPQESARMAELAQSCLRDGR